MGETILNATERTGNPKKLRGTGFIPGVLYGDSVALSTPVKFEESALRKVLSDHGSNAKIWVTYEDSKRFGVIREVQRQSISGKIIHIDVQLMSQDHEVKLQLPITFKGKENLEAKQLTLQIYKSEIEVMGKAALMPDSIVIDVSEKKAGDNIIAADFVLDQQFEVQDSADEVYGVITAIRIEQAAETV